jgi:uncharacterized protein YjbJ (UPF0337 family)
MGNRTDKISGMATPAAGKVKGNVCEATGSRELGGKGACPRSKVTAEHHRAT